MTTEKTADELTKVGSDFVGALAARDFERLRACFRDDAALRALVPSALREGASDAEAVAWFRTWFWGADELILLDASVGLVAQQVHIAYRIRLHEKAAWYVVEQQAYCVVKDGLIGAMNLLCSGFRLDPGAPDAQAQLGPGGDADAYYDAGALGCADGPLDEIARLMRGLAAGQTLSVRASDPSVVKDLPAWCRMVGHACEAAGPEHFLVRHK